LSVFLSDVLSADLFCPQAISEIDEMNKNVNPIIILNSFILIFLR